MSEITTERDKNSIKVTIRIRPLSEKEKSENA